MFKGALKEAIKKIKDSEKRTNLLRSADLLETGKTSCQMHKNFQSKIHLDSEKKYGLSNYPSENLRFGTKCCSKIRTGSVLNKSEEDDSEELKIRTGFVLNESKEDDSEE